jgi:hypothetical protein
MMKYTYKDATVVTPRPYMIPSLHQISTTVIQRLIKAGVQMNRAIWRHSLGDPPLARSVTVPPISTSAVELVAALSEARFTASFIAVIVMLLSECWLTGSQSHC